MQPHPNQVSGAHEGWNSNRIETNCATQPHPSIRLHHQILQTFSRTIASPFLQPNAFANSAMFESGPFPRNCGKGCGLVFVNNRAYSGRVFAPQTCAHPRKNRCSGVNPSLSAGRPFPASDFSYAAYEIVKPPRSAMLSPKTNFPF